MKLHQYQLCLDLMKEGWPLEAIQKVTCLPVSEVHMMNEGARIAPSILCQCTGVYERCPECGHKVQLPCYQCFMRKHPELDCIEVVERPLRNQRCSLPVMLDKQLLEGDYIDEEF